MAEGPTAPDSAFRFTVICAVYGVARYLPDFFASLEAQSFDHGRIQVVAVDDGSTDGSADLVREWAQGTGYAVTVLTKENGGQSSARNLGLTVASGEWVTFTDPDDILDPEYFTQIHRLLEERPDVCMAAANLLDYRDGAGEVTNSHPLRWRFEGGTKVINVDRYPRYFHLPTNSAFFRLRELRELGLAFDERVAPTFEDGHFIQRFLLARSDRKVAFIAGAKYLYRRRDDGTSTLQTSNADPRKYTNVLRYGYLDLLKRAAALGGPIPRWLQNVIIYDLTWYFRGEEAMFSSSAGIAAETAAEFHRLVTEIRSHLELSAIERFDLIDRAPSQRDVLARGYSDEDWHWDRVIVNRLDEDRQLVELRYRFTGTQPHEAIRVRGIAVTPVHSKTRSLNYFHQARLSERILWVSAQGTLEVELNGTPTAVTFQWPRSERYALRPAEIRSVRATKRRQLSSRPARRPKPVTARIPAQDRRALMVSSLPTIRRLFADAWVLMDRDENSHDNAEHLFRYLRKHRRDINAWFVVRKGTPDWERLKRDGYKRLIPYGSTLWMALCLNAKHIVSSHADRYVYEPFRLATGHKPEWKFTFLQHGVIKDDLSRWLNSKNISNFVTTTPAEHASIAGSGSPYVFTTREARLTGLPRHDRLARLARKASSTGQKRSIVIMPTWREYLVGKQRVGISARGANPAFFESEFHREWLGFLQSERLKDLCGQYGLDIVFMPHPNLKPYLPELDLPGHVAVKTYDEADVQEVLAGAALIVTDYSSVAFDAAFLRRSIAYFQFDKATVFGGAHLTRPGYFSYERDGFGPVAYTLRELLDGVADLLDPDSASAALYRERMDRTFTLPQKGACARVVRMIERSERPLTFRQARLRTVAPPEAPPINFDFRQDMVPAAPRSPQQAPSPQESAAPTEDGAPPAREGTPACTVGNVREPASDVHS